MLTFGRNHYIVMATWAHPWVCETDCAEVFFLPKSSWGMWGIISCLVWRWSSLLELCDGFWPLILNFYNCSQVLSSCWLPTPWIIFRVLTSLSEHFKPLKDMHTRRCFISVNIPSILFVSVVVLLSLKTVLKFAVAAVWQQENTN